MKRNGRYKSIAKKLLKSLALFAKDIIKAFIIAILIRILFVLLGL